MPKTPVRSLLCALALALPAAPALAAGCEATVNSTDSMRFETDKLEISRSCTSFKLTLKHTGKLPKAAMGHNLVIVRTSDLDAVAKDAIAAGAAGGYLKSGDDRVLAATKLLGGGESDTITFDTKALLAAGDMTFICTFPGHSSLMKGKVVLVN